MSTVQVDLPEDLLKAASILGQKFSPDLTSREVAKLLALELFREDVVSLGLAARLCGVPQAEFMQFAAERGVPMHYTFDDIEEDRQVIESLLS